MARGKKDVKVTVTVKPDGTLDFHVHGDVNGKGVIEVKKGDTDTINWSLNGHGPNGAVTFAADPIQWVGTCNGKTGDPWPLGAPLAARTSDTEATTTVANTASNPNTITHLYSINVTYNGVSSAFDPEIDEQGDTHVP